ncbi:MAG: alpha-L-rhamnosidase C-terminal domain-containing protein, partial [Phycisphaerae bacterium]
SGQVINNVFLDRFLMELTMRDLREEAQGGRPATALPVSYINNTPYGGIPGYSNAWYCGLADFYRHTGALGYIRLQHQLMLSMLRYIKQGFNRKNIFVNKNKGWCFVDWADHLGFGNAPQSIIATDLDTCLAVRRAVFLLNAIGDKANAAKYARWDRLITLAARKYLVNPKTHTFTNLRQVNAMAIDSHVADAQQRAAIYARILGPQCPSWQQKATPYYNNFVLFSLGHLGHFKQALSFIHLYWGAMIQRGATTFWERFSPTWPTQHFHKAAGYAMSLCHGWSAGVTSWLTECVLGVQPQTGGFAQTDIVPHLGGLKWARGRVPTPHGNILLRVAEADGGESMALTLPPDVHAVVGVVGRSVTVNGTAATPFRKSRDRCYIDLAEAGVYKIVGHK